MREFPRDNCAKNNVGGEVNNKLEANLHTEFCPCTYFLLLLQSNRSGLKPVIQWKNEYMVSNQQKKNRWP